MKLGLALSGGGVRAAAFHLGLLRRLAAEDLFESVSQISTVSGGSLIIGALFGVTGNRWPTSDEYRTVTYPALKQLLTTTDLFDFKAIGLSGILRFNYRLLHDRAGILAEVLRTRWKVTLRLADLPDTPNWWINTTCLETGKNWRFSKREMGDWSFGRHYNPPFLVADAIAASAAVPYAIGALKIQLPEAGWYRTDPATRAPIAAIHTMPSVHLWDGGAYENLGLEPLYKPRQGLIDCDFLICSDASAPLGPTRSGQHIRNILAGRLASPRLFDIAADQIRALRSRMLVNAIEGGQLRASLVRMGNSTRDIDIKSGRTRDSGDYDFYLSDERVASAIGTPTHLKALTPSDFDLISRHGFEAADGTLTAHAGDQFQKNFLWTSQ